MFIKKILDKLPSIGDYVEVVNNDEIIYNSGCKVPINSPCDLDIGDTVRDVNHCVNENKLVINVCHENDDTFSEIDIK